MRRFEAAVSMAGALALAFGAVASAQVFDDPDGNGLPANQFVVSAGVCQVHVLAHGAAGGDGEGSGDPLDGRSGGTTDAVIPVTAGETLHVFVGGVGATGAGGGAAGINGGGAGGNASEGRGGGGGGASDVRQGGPTLANRNVVAGGCGC